MLYVNFPLEWRPEYDSRMIFSSEKRMKHIFYAKLVVVGCFKDFLSWSNRLPRVAHSDSTIRFYNWEK